MGGQELQAAALKDWLEGAVSDWAPEIPWERLLRPAMFNKAKAGSGATIAGLEFLAPTTATGARYRAYALGDSCVMQLRAGGLLLSRPVGRAEDFGYDPKLLMTRPGFEAKYAAAWQEWEGALEPGDWLLLATDALSEHILRQFETGAAGPLLAALAEGSATPGPDGWRRLEALVQTRRRQGELRNDDVGLVIIHLRPP